MSKTTLPDLVKQIRSYILEARSAVARSANFAQVWTNYQIGRLIVKHEQEGKARARYAAGTLNKLSGRLTKEFGRGFTKRNLELMRKFFLIYQTRIPKSAISNLPQHLSQPPKTKSLISQSAGPSRNSKRKSLITKSEKETAFFQLSWTHLLFLMSIEDEDERSFYEIEAASQNWSVRKLRRQFDSSLYERLAMSRDKKKVRELGKKGQVVENPEDAIKEPVVLEFLGLDEKAEYTETHLETAIIDKIESFLLEMGKGFLFEARQKRMTINDKHFHVDLVLYNRLLRCYVLIDLKIGEIKHQNIGQMQMYVNYYDRKMINDDENLTVGIVLCKKKDDALVEITLPKDNKQIFASKYKLLLPSKAQLRRQIRQVQMEVEN